MIFSKEEADGLTDWRKAAPDPIRRRSNYFTVGKGRPVRAGFRAESGINKAIRFSERVGRSRMQFVLKVGFFMEQGRTPPSSEEVTTGERSRFRLGPREGPHDRRADRSSLLSTPFLTERGMRRLLDQNKLSIQ